MNRLESQLVHHEQSADTTVAFVLNLSRPSTSSSSPILTPIPQLSSTSVSFSLPRPELRNGFGSTASAHFSVESSHSHSIHRLRLRSILSSRNSRRTFSSFSYRRRGQRRPSRSSIKLQGCPGRRQRGWRNRARTPFEDDRPMRCSLGIGSRGGAAPSRSQEGKHQ